VPDGLEQLNGWFTTWAEHEYHVRAHSSTGVTPLERWTAGTPRFLPAAALDAAFLWEAIRTVAARTATIKFQGNTYETAPELAGQAVTIRYSPFDLTRIEVFHRGTSHGHAQPHAIARHCHPKVKQAPQAVPAVTCARSFKMRMAASLAVRMCGCEEGPAGGSRRGLGVRGGVVVVSLP